MIPGSVIDDRINQGKINQLLAEDHVALKRDLLPSKICGGIKGVRPEMVQSVER